MKIPMKEALKELRGERQRVPVTRRLAVTRESDRLDGNYVGGDVRYQVTHEAVFRVNQIVPDNGDALVQAQRNAERMVMRGVYGPVCDVLHEVLHFMWEDGVEGLAKDRLEVLLRELEC